MYHKQLARLIENKYRNNYSVFKATYIKKGNKPEENNRDENGRTKYIVRISDIEAGNSAGCKCIFIDYDYSETKGKKIGTSMIVRSLPQAVDLIKKL